MKASTYTAYGPPSVLRVTDVPTPEPGAHEVRIRIRAAAVTTADNAFRSGKPFFARFFTGLLKPKRTILGTELAGEIDAVGTAVTRFSAGDEVYGATGARCSAHAEYICMGEQDAIAIKPANTTFEEAAGISEALTALPFLRDQGKIQPGQHVLINGASGVVGSYAVQLAVGFGAEVTAVCSTANVERMKALGARHVIDYTQTDFTRSGHTYHCIFDVVGKSSWSRCRKLLKPEGKYLSTVPSPGLMLLMLYTTLTGSKRVRFQATGLRPPAERAKDLDILRELVEAGTLQPAIDRIFPLEAIAAAHSYVDEGHKKGNVVVTMVADVGRRKNET